MGAKVELVFHTKEVIRTIENMAFKRMLEAANEVRNTVLETLSGSRSGRTYKVPGTRRTYTASAPGQPPAVATARLRQSVKTSIEVENRAVVGKVGTDLEYGKALEFGTKNMAARPWLKRSFDESMDKVKGIFGKKWL